MTIKNKLSNLVWEGKKLIQIDDNISYKYNHEGIRTEKTVNNQTTKFELEGSNIISSINTTTQDRLDFNYDVSQTLIGFSRNGIEYFYERDILGNINKILDINGEIVVEYRYLDAWGNFEIILDTTDNLGVINPFKYKGYYYDEETNLYYLKSRYYDSIIKRFISMDDYNYLDSNNYNGLNLYAYCLNNPVMYYDPSGCYSIGIYDDSPFSWLDVKAFYFSIYSPFQSDYSFNKKKYGISFLKAEIGVLKAKFYSPKFFSSLSNDNILNPNVLLEVKAWNASANVGLGIDGKLVILSAEVGVELGNALKISAEGYVGLGWTLDFSKGIKFGAGVGLGYTVSIEFDWDEVFDLFKNIFKK